jgi:hypothetical protein
MEVRTHKLDKASVNVFGSVTDVMLYWYIALYLIIYWFDRAFIGIQLLQLAFPILPLIPIHFLVVAFLETPWANRVQAAFRFGFFSADRYVISVDPNPLIHVIPRPTPEASTPSQPEHLGGRHAVAGRPRAAQREVRA